MHLIALYRYLNVNLMLINCKFNVNFVFLTKDMAMHSLDKLKRIKKRLHYKYWVFTIKLKLYALKYKRVLEMPYRY